MIMIQSIDIKEFRNRSLLIDIRTWEAIINVFVKIHFVLLFM